jgi:threonine synthase
MLMIADQNYVASIEMVTAPEVGQAMMLLSNLHKTLVEPTGALSLAAARKRAQVVPTQAGQRPVEHHITLTTGINVDQKVYDEFVELASKKHEEDVRRQRTDAKRAAELSIYLQRILRLRLPMDGSNVPLCDYGRVKEGHFMPTRMAVPASSVQGTNVWSGPVGR